MINTDLNYLRENSDKIKEMLETEFDDETFDIIMNETRIDIREFDKQLQNYTPKAELKYKKLKIGRAHV